MLTFFLVLSSIMAAPAPQTAQLQTVRTQDKITLRGKRYENPGKTPVILVAGWGSNDYLWDPQSKKLSMARFLYDSGYDVWIINKRGEGTHGFRSDTPFPNRWTVEDFATLDLPPWVDRVISVTGKKPWLLGHSMGAWVIDAYLLGLTRKPTLHTDLSLQESRQDQVLGVVTVSGLYNTRWPISWHQRFRHPIKTEHDYFNSNYEAEILANQSSLYQWVGDQKKLPMGWLPKLIDAPLESIPFLGKILDRWYQGFQSNLVQFPLLSLFFYPKHTTPEHVLDHARKGLEDLGPRLTQQFMNSILDQALCGYFNRKESRCSLDFSKIRRNVTVPYLFVGGQKDRLTHWLTVFEDGYLKSNSTQKSFFACEVCGHLDILSGSEAESRVWKPVTQWMESIPKGLSVHSTRNDSVL